MLLGLITAWTVSWFGNRAVMEAQDRAMARYRAQYAVVKQRGPQDTDLAAVLPALETLRTMPDGTVDWAKRTPLSLTFGLYQGGNCTDAAQRRL